VRSIVGRFLEAQPTCSTSTPAASACLLLTAPDWMGRNLSADVETCFPIEGPKLKKRRPNGGDRELLAETAGVGCLRATARTSTRARGRVRRTCAQRSALLSDSRAGLESPRSMTRQSVPLRSVSRSESVRDVESGLRSLPRRARVRPVAVDRAWKDLSASRGRSGARLHGVRASKT